MNTEVRPKPPLSGLVYGEIVYWGTLIGSFVAIIGAVVTFVTKRNFVDPGYMLTAIWQGKSVEEIWTGATGALPHGHWYIHNLFTGNGLAEFGLAIGVFTITPACLGAAIFLFKEKEPIFGTMAAIAGFITILSMIGVFSI